jgi:hypothetical protein
VSEAAGKITEQVDFSRHLKGRTGASAFLPKGVLDDQIVSRNLASIGETSRRLEAIFGNRAAKSLTQIKALDALGGRPFITSPPPRTPLKRAVWEQERTEQLIEVVQRGLRMPAAPRSAAVAPVEVETEIGPAAPVEITPENFAEISAGADARFNRQAAEELLVSEGLEHELRHLRYIVVLLKRGDAECREYAALAASKILQGVANRFSPATKNSYWKCRWGDKREIGYPHTANRISFYLDRQLRSYMTTQEHRRLEGKLYFVADFAGNGHHQAHELKLSIMAYADLLETLAYIARARRVERGSYS